MVKAAFQFQLRGQVAARRDAVVKLVNEATGQSVERKPFLDGSLVVRDLDPGFWQVEVTHPNLIQPVFTKRVRLFPQPAPTLIPVPVPEELFRDTQIRDVPDADLGPVQQVAAGVRDSVTPIAGKAPGEVIRAADFNTLAAAVADLAQAVGELTRMVSPRGHDHPEIAEKIGEVQENLRRFADAYGRSLLELRREIETLSLRRRVADVLDIGGANEETRDRVLGRVRDLEVSLQADTPVFTGKLANTGLLLSTAINELAVAQGDAADTFLANESVQTLTQIARQYSVAGTQTRSESELNTYGRTSTAGGAKLMNLF